MTVVHHGAKVEIPRLGRSVSLWRNDGQCRLSSDRAVVSVFLHPSALIGQRTLTCRVKGLNIACIACVNDNSHL